MMFYVVVVVVVVIVVAANEVRSEEIERKRKPKNPFVIFMKMVFFLLLRSNTMFMHEFHFNIVSFVF